mgnify:CR=1 FL=1
MKTRSIKNLLIIVRDNLKIYFQKDIENGGMCAVIEDLNKEGIISWPEREQLMSYLDNHIPQNAIKRKEKYDGGWEDDKGYVLAVFWWKPKSIAPRIKWLSEQINSLK